MRRLQPRTAPQRPALIRCTAWRANVRGGCRRRAWSRPRDSLCGCERCALWRALVRCGDLAAGRQPRAAPPACTPRSVRTTLNQLKQAPLVLGVDLYKPGHKPGVVEVVAVFPSA